MERSCLCRCWLPGILIPQRQRRLLLTIPQAESNHELWILGEGV